MKTIGKIIFCVLAAIMVGLFSVGLFGLIYEIVTNPERFIAWP